MSSVLSGRCELQVPDLLLLQTAGQWAATGEKQNALRTRSLHTELVFSLSGSKHVSWAQSSPWSFSKPPILMTLYLWADWRVSEAVRRQ